MARAAIAWCVAEQVALLRAVGRRAGLEFTIAGSPVRGQSAAVARALEAQPADDLRAVMAAADAVLVLIGAAGEFGAAPEDAAAVATARSRGSRVATLDPLPASALALRSAGWAEVGPGGRPIDGVRFVPLARSSASFRESAELRDHLGPPRAVLVRALSDAPEGTLGSRLFDALDVVAGLLGEPESLHAAYVGESLPTGLHTLPPENLRGLHGDLAVTLRFGDGRAAAIFASDRASRWDRSITLLGPGGRATIDDAGFGLVGPGGVEDESRRRGAGPPTADSVIGDQLARLLDPALPDAAPADAELVLACAQAALLSARTGQAESPATIRVMARA